MLSIHFCVLFFVQHSHVALAEVDAACRSQHADKLVGLTCMSSPTFCVPLPALPFRLCTVLPMFCLRVFFYPSSDPSHNRVFMELAWPCTITLAPLTECHIQMRKMKQETSKAALSLWGAGLVPWEMKTRVHSHTTEWGFSHLQPSGWGELGYRGQMPFQRVAMPHL